MTDTPRAPLPLAGRVVLVTRPAHQAATLTQSIEASGGRALVFPLLSIAPTDTPAPLNALAARLHEHDIVCFVSQNAVAHACPILLAHQPWPEHVVPVVLGPSSRRALEAFGVRHIVSPSGPFDSETLLLAPALQAQSVRGKSVVILRGQGGRELLADTLRARGAHVTTVPCYQRSRPAGKAALVVDALANGTLSAITLTSSEGLRNFLDLLGPERHAIGNLPVFVPHARIQHSAQASGLCHVVLTPPGDAGLIAGMEQYFSAPTD